MKARNIILAALLCLRTLSGYSQTWAEFFKQRKTQRKYLIEQIAAMQVYLDYARKGYNIVKDGSALVGDIKSGDFSLHRDYFSSLKTVDPSISDMDKVKDIQKMHDAMARNRSAILILLKESSKVFSGAEAKAITDLYANIAAEAAKDLEELKLLTQSGKLELSDDERISRIDKLYSRMRRNYGFQMQTGARINALFKSRKATLREAEVMKKLYEID